MTPMEANKALELISRGEAVRATRQKPKPEENKVLLGKPIIIETKDVRPKRHNAKHNRTD
jgi:hypothetical protein